MGVAQGDLQELTLPQLDQRFRQHAKGVTGQERETFVADLAFVHAVESRWLASLPAAVARLLREEVPERIRLAGGRVVPVNYEAGKPPWIESRLQDFFGTPTGPSICKGRVRLTLHLLAPNRRAVQVTSDLASFWRQHYPTIRRELCRRYPRHPWPEDGATATPPAPHGPGTRQASRTVRIR